MPELIATSVPAIPTDFVLGTATAAWQVEGDSAGRGRCIWDDLAERPGAIRDGATADPACNHVVRLEEDLDLIAWLGVDAYRFSISWPRVLPQGRGNPAASGLDFYDRLIDGLLARGIAPIATLYHWDLPSALNTAGGWSTGEPVDAFEDYAGLCAQRWGDRVTQWATLNEPWCSAFLGYAAGVHAPGVRDGAAALAAAYHLLVAHAKGAAAVRAAGGRDVGLVLNVSPVLPETPDMQPAATLVDAVQNRLWLDPLAGRGLPSDLIEATRALTDWSFVDATDLAAVAGSLDWLGVNYYTVMRIAAAGTGAVDAVGQDTDAYPGVPPFRFAPRPPVTQMGWEVYAPGLTDLLRDVATRLPGVPLMVTENGAAYDDPAPVDGVVADPDRVAYLQAHLAAILAARDAGVDVRGWLVWSLLDNLEWAEGWTKTFGIIQIDPASGTRTPKSSAHWVRDLQQHR